MSANVSLPDIAIYFCCLLWNEPREKTGRRSLLIFKDYPINTLPLLHFSYMLTTNLPNIFVFTQVYHARPVAMQTASF